MRSAERCARMRARRASERVMVGIYPTHPEAPHGTYTGYISYACRCESCREANRVEVNARNARRRILGLIKGSSH